MKKHFALILALLLTVVSLCSCKIGPPSERVVESIVEKSIPEQAHCESARNEKEHVYYTFRSDLRDLTFEVVAFQNQTGFGGYWERIDYSRAVREHYKNDLYAELKSCPYFRGRKEDAEGNYPFEFNYRTEEDARKIAGVIAKLNKIVSDQFEYTPDADLTSSKIMCFRMEILKIDQSKDDAVIYILNGTDGEDDIYRKIVQGKQEAS